MQESQQLPQAYSEDELQKAAYLLSLLRELQPSAQAYSEDEKRKAAYALNLCTVSISQIIDYNDTYVLEQEYNAILNNLNLEAIPKDEALLRILVEILNVCTFFRIQEKKKQKLEADYQRRVKNAVWSAIPNFSVIVSGNPVAMALSLATQVGTGYMNYRKEKASAKSERENAEFELEITAMEQFHALRRELFTTAWRLADSYSFPDEWRLTENQIKQYDQILMDPDEYRKYARLEAIAPNFEAYAPFWYFYAHTALYISQNEGDDTFKSNYRKRAKAHFEKYRKLNEFSLLREDQLAASALLEYAELLLTEHEDAEKIHSLIQQAQKMAGTAKDILQLCAVSYLKIGKTDDAARLLKLLVNEEYNTSMNAKVLSRIYVSQYLTAEPDKRETAEAEYKTLSKRVSSNWLFPMPEKSHPDKETLETYFIRCQRKDLIAAYRSSLQDYWYRSLDLYETSLHEIFQQGYSMEDRPLLTSNLHSGVYGKICLDRLNGLLTGLDSLPLFTELPNRENLIEQIVEKARNIGKSFQELQKKTADDFTASDYKELAKILSFEKLTKDFFDALKHSLSLQILETQAIGKLNLLEGDLIEFCKEQNLPEPRYLGFEQSKKIPETKEPCLYLDGSLLGITCDPEKQQLMTQKMKDAVKNAKEQLIKDAFKAEIYLEEDPKFDIYFKNTELKPSSCTDPLKLKAVAVIDDKTRNDYDLILTTSGIVVVRQNKILNGTIRYEKVEIRVHGEKQSLKLRLWEEYKNDALDLQSLYDLFRDLSSLMKNAP